MTSPRPFAREQAAAFLAFADAVLGAPPTRPYTERHAGKGRLVLRFALPLEMAQPRNRARHQQGWQAARERSSLVATMACQLASQLAGPDGRITAKLAWCADGKAMRPMWPAPLPGRPMVRGVRFSSVDADPLADWIKVALDVLQPPKVRAGRMVAGLGVIANDRAADIELRCWGEVAPRGSGGALIEIYSGDPHA